MSQITLTPSQQNELTQIKCELTLLKQKYPSDMVTIARSESLAGVGLIGGIGHALLNVKLYNESIQNSQVMQIAGNALVGMAIGAAIGMALDFVCSLFHKQVVPEETNEDLTRIHFLAQRAIQLLEA